MFQVKIPYNYSYTYCLFNKANKTCFYQLRKEKVDLENTLEQEQELLVNRLWKRMDRLEAEKRFLNLKKKIMIMMMLILIQNLVIMITVF